MWDFQKFVNFLERLRKFFKYEEKFLGKSWRNLKIKATSTSNMTFLHFYKTFGYPCGNDCSCFLDVLSLGVLNSVLPLLPFQPPPENYQRKIYEEIKILWGSSHFFMKNYILFLIIRYFSFQESSRSKPVLLVVSVTGIKVCSPDGTVSNNRFNIPFPPSPAPSRTVIKTSSKDNLIRQWRKRSYIFIWFSKCPNVSHKFIFELVSFALIQSKKKNVNKSLWRNRPLSDDFVLATLMELPNEDKKKITKVCCPLLFSFYWIIRVTPRFYAKMEPRAPKNGRSSVVEKIFEIRVPVHVVRHFVLMFIPHFK